MPRSRYRIVQYANLPTYVIQERRWFLWPYWYPIGMYPWEGDGLPGIIGRLNTLDAAKAALARCQAAEMAERQGWHPVDSRDPLPDTWLDHLLFWVMCVAVVNLLLMLAYATYHMFFG